MSKNKTVSLDEAFRILESWKGERLVVQVSFSCGVPMRDNFFPIRANVQGVIISVNPPNAVGTVTLQGDVCGLELDLRESLLTRFKPTEPPVFGGDAFAAQFCDGLNVKTPLNGEFLFLAFSRGN